MSCIIQSEMAELYIISNTSGCPEAAEELQYLREHAASIYEQILPPLYQEQSVRNQIANSEEYLRTIGCTVDFTAAGKMIIATCRRSGCFPE